MYTATTMIRCGHCKRSHETVAEVRKCGMPVKTAPKPFTPTHDYAREENHETGMMRLRCSCGTRSRWSSTIMPVFIAQDRHAENVAKRSWIK